MLTFQEMLLQAAMESDAVGWSAWEIARDADRRISAMFPLPCYTLRATKRDPSREYEVYAQSVGGVVRYFVGFGSEASVSKDDPDTPAKDEKDAANELLVFRHYSPRSPIYGVPRWIAIMPSIAELSAIREHNLSVFTGSGQIDRLIHVEARDVEVAKQKADALANNILDCRGAQHTTLITSGSADVKVAVTPFVTGPRDASYLRRREDLVKEVLMGHHVPPYRIGWAEIGSLGGSAAKEMLRAYRIGAIEDRKSVV